MAIRKQWLMAQINHSSVRAAPPWPFVSNYARYNENNIYVHSNQPYTDATASADGYLWSYETDGSGYAIIYLNGPPAGADVMVTVGAVTCTATRT